MSTIGNSFRMAITVAMLASSTLVHESFGQAAYCALRNPTRLLYQEFPEADGHRSIIRTATIEDRSLISTALPFTLDFNELGRHTLYVPVKEGVALGLVHVRSEVGPFGLTEIAWSLTLDGKIINVSLQRCRDAEVREIVTNRTLFPQVEGADVPTLLQLLNDEALSNASRLLLESAVKTTAITMILWEEDLLPARAAMRATIAWSESDPILTSELITLSSLPLNSGLQPRSIRIWAVTSRANGEELGTMVRSLWTIDEYKAELWWEINQHGKIINVEIFNSNDASIGQAFREVVGLELAKIGECATSAGVAAGAILEAINETKEAKQIP
jgi:uncharacterized protein YuzE